jgi:glutathione S-transferase
MRVTLTTKSDKEGERSSMSYRLWYFPFRGRAEQIRLLFAMMGVSFEDRRIRKAEFIELKEQGASQLYFGSLPMLEDGDFRLSQGPVIMNYLARKHGLAPSEIKAAAKAEAIVLGAEDLRTVYFRMFGEDAESKQKAFLDNDWKQRWLSHLEELLELNSSHMHLVGDSETQADVAFWDALNSVLTFIPNASLDGYPKVEAFYHRLAQWPSWQSYLKERPEK